MLKTCAAVASALCLVGPALAASAPVDAMRGQRRILVVSAPTAGDPRLEAQRSNIARWRGAADRDVSTVQIVGGRVDGASDGADALRARFGLPGDRFAAALVGKDGHVALRSAEPIDAAALEGTIDAMPMRRAGLR